VSTRPTLPSFGGSPFANPVDTGELDRRLIERIIDEVRPQQYREYTPTWTATTTDPGLGNTGLVSKAFYQLVGNWCSFSVYWLLGTSVTAGSGTYVFNLPIPAMQLGDDAEEFIGHGVLTDVSTSPDDYYHVVGVVGTNRTNMAFRVDGAGGGSFTNTNPVIIADGDRFGFQGHYPVDLS